MTRAAVERAICLADYDLGWLCRCSDCRPANYCKHCGCDLYTEDDEPTHAADCPKRDCR